MGRISPLQSVVFLCIIAFSRFGNGYQGGTLDVLDFGARGDGATDDTKAFISAWSKLCSSGQVLKIPAGKSFLVKPFVLAGPCKSSNVVIQIDGKIVAPSSIEGWGEDVCKMQCWLCFQYVKGLTIKGAGLINGKGAIWWNQNTQSIDESKFNCGAPTALYFFKCDQLQLAGFSSLDSPRIHIFIYRSQGVRISNLKLNAPENSPNTDGIGISFTSQVTIQDSVIKTGDDCVAIKEGSSYVNVTGVTCGPGHGFSVGSLGRVSSTVDEVEQIYFQNCICQKTLYCARIKTYEGGSGYARKISYKGMTLSQSYNPILIDQHYSLYTPLAAANGGGVKVSDIQFIGFTGTSWTPEAIQLDCSDLGCSNILMDNVMLTSSNGKSLTSVCNKATGRARLTNPPVPCLSSGKRSELSPSIAPSPVMY